MPHMLPLPLAEDDTEVTEEKAPAPFHPWTGIPSAATVEEGIRLAMLIIADRINSARGAK